MNWFHNVVLSLIMLTTLDGKPVWVEASQIVIIRHSIDCAHGNATALRIAGSAALCVQESIEQIRTKIKESEDDDLTRWRPFNR